MRRGAEAFFCEFPCPNIVFRRNGLDGWSLVSIIVNVEDVVLHCSMSPAAVAYTNSALSKLGKVRPARALILARVIRYDAVQIDKLLSAHSCFVTADSLAEGALPQLYEFIDAIAF